jgi:endonuclease YncB( thermonuclease family)
MPAAPAATVLIGTSVETEIDRVVDGDTLVVQIAGDEQRLRLLCLDTEESNPGGDKPVTPWGREAKKEAERLLPVGAAVTLEFPGTEPLDQCLVRHRDNFGRLLVFAHFERGDFQEHMIAAGYSPYFNKYGHADFASHHERYVAAERNAQAAHVGVWDQVTVNGSEMRNYATLGAWWRLRAAIIDDYRRHRAADSSLLNSRLDYAELRELAAQEREATVFTELASVTRVGQRRAIVDIGSRQQPFKLFVPDIESDDGRRLLALLKTRYIADDPDRIRRSYAYVRGQLKLFRDEPELVVVQASQVTDTPPSGLG